MNLFLLLVGLSLAEIHIWEPPRLKSHFASKKLDYTITNFGNVPYRHSIYGTVIKASPIEACQPLNDLNWDRNYGVLILLIDRGQCQFSEKILHAQRAGAELVIIGDNTNEDINKIMAVERNKELLYKITIPSILISKENASVLKRVLDSSQYDKTITLDINFPVAKPSEITAVKVIMQIDDVKSYEVMSSIARYYSLFSEVMSLQVFYKVYKLGQVESSSENCFLGDVTYCVLPESEDEQSGLMDETLRHLCVFHSSREAYFSLVEQTKAACFETDGKPCKNFATCSSKALAEIANSKLAEQVKVCIEETPQVIALLNSSFNAIRHNLFNYSPLIYINDSLYKGDYMDENSLIEAFCNNFENTPKGCDKL